MSEAKSQGSLVFGLDIGTRSIVGTVGYREGDNFIIKAQSVKEHETRAMLDGQIHDIGQVGNTINIVKKDLEKKLSVKLENVCIAAAGRVLRTVEVNTVKEYDRDTVITPDDVASLTSLAVEKAYEQFQEINDTDLKFYCVGNSVVRYYLNGYQIGNLENHKARSIGVDMIATFLPDDVVDGLYKAVELAGLKVVNMTLEPIAAIAVAIPENYRMLNIALVDVGAGTSDICITKDGCIIAYGMIPIAGDSLTEIIAKQCLVDFATAEKIKRGNKTKRDIKYTDIMGLTQKIAYKDVITILDEQVTYMTKEVSDKIKELNGGKPVSAVFVVGGGGKIEGYTTHLADHLGIMAQRVALRGEDVMQKIVFEENIKKDSLLVTPIGICLNYYEQSNNFVHVSFNEEQIKLYDNGNLAVVDAAMHAKFPNEGLFPKRGDAIEYKVNGTKKIARGTLGEAAVIRINGDVADLYAPIRANDIITVTESTKGEPALLTLDKLPEYKSAISVNVNGQKIALPKFAKVNGELKSGFYDIKNKDKIEILDYYTVAELKEYMDVNLDDSMTVVVNNEEADEDTLVYDNFSVQWVLKSERKSKLTPKQKAGAEYEEDLEDTYDNLPDADEEEPATDVPVISQEPAKSEPENVEEVKEQKLPVSIGVLVNHSPVTLKGKAEYVFVDVFDYIDFDTSKVQGKELITTLNGVKAEYLQSIKNGDIIEIRWN